jgi:hypothetical protein
MQKEKTPDPEMPEKNRQIEQTILDSWGPRFLEAFKK